MGLFLTPTYRKTMYSEMWQNVTDLSIFCKISLIIFVK